MLRSVVRVHAGPPIHHYQNLSGKPLGGLAQLARAPALQAGGQRFDSVILHFNVGMLSRVNHPIKTVILVCSFEH